MHPGAGLVHLQSTIANGLDFSVIFIPDSLTHSAGDRPTLQELQYFQYTSDRGAVESVYIMDAIAPRWKKLGIALGFSGPQLDSIERSKLKDVEDCCLELLEQWLQGRVVGRPLTWRTLLLAMVQTGQCTSVAQQVWTVLAGGSSAEGEQIMHATLHG